MVRERSATEVQAEAKTEETRQFVRQANTARDATQAEVEALEWQRDQLKQLVAELSLLVNILKNQRRPASTKEAVPVDEGSASRRRMPTMDAGKGSSDVGRRSSSEPQHPGANLSGW